MGHTSLPRGSFKCVFEFRGGAKTLKMCRWGTGDRNGLALARGVFMELRAQGYLSLG